MPQDKLFLYVGLGLLVLAILVALVVSSDNSSQLEIIPAENLKSTKILVDISGAVQKPGIYQFESGARWHEAIATAGGLSQDADRDWVAKTLNLASPLKDGIKIYIKPTNDIAMVNQGVEPGGLVNINTASVSELDTLPGIGPQTAAKIISWRDKNGPFSQPEDIMGVPGVGQATFDSIKDAISVW